MKYFWFLISRILRHSRLCYLFKIYLNYCNLYFFPTSVSATLFLNPNFPDEDYYFLNKYLKKNDCFVDVGANIGHIAIAGSKIVSPSGKVIAIEANDRIANFLKQNVKLNNLNIDCLSKIVGSKLGNAFIENRKADDMNRVRVKDNVGGGRSREIDTLDNICRDLDKVNLLKIDVEGYELPVLQGGINTLKKTQAIYIEVIDELFKFYSYTKEDLFDFLENQDFKFREETDNNNLIFVKNT